MVAEDHVRIAEIQKEIESYLGGLDSNSIIFEFRELKDGLLDLDLITVNPRHRQSFLFHSTEGRSKVEVLEAMLDYVKNYKDKESSYTIQWSLKGEGELHTSYFRSKNILEAIDKLYYGRDMNSVTIFSVVLNPIS
jgi:hypothetical protein